jgi:hypothetical protein
MALRVKLFVLVSLFLAACSSTPQQNPVTEPLETVPMPTFELQSLALPDWSASDNVDVEVIGIGLGNRYGDGSGNLTDSITIPDPDNVTALYTQVVFKYGDRYIAPDGVTVTSDSESKSFSNGGLSLSLPTDDNGVALDNVGHMYEAIFAPSSSLTVDIQGTGFSNLLTPRALIVYILRPAQGAGNNLSVGSVPNFYLYGQQGYVSASQTITVPASDNARDVDVTFAISELGAVRNLEGDPDTRTVELYVEAGSVTNSGIFEFPNNADELLITTLTLAGVPAGVTDVTATVVSQPIPPGGNVYDYGDSVYWNGLDVNVVLDAAPEPEPEPGIEGCTPGYWKNHAGARRNQTNSWPPTGYAPNDALSSVWPQTNTYNLGDKSLLNGLNFGGGGGNRGAAKILLRAAVAGLLNASHPDVDYAGLSESALIDAVGAALASQDRATMLDLADRIDQDNNAGCPIGRGISSDSDDTSAEDSDDGNGNGNGNGRGNGRGNGNGNGNGRGNGRR